MTDAGYSEHRRQLVHMAMGGFALLLRWLPWTGAVLLATAAVLFNVTILPRIAGQRIYRPGTPVRALHTGIVLYPISVLLLLLFFPRAPHLAAAAWGVLAIGDGMATLVGRAVDGARWTWNREKTVAGSAAFVVTGAIAGVALAWWCAPAAAPPPSASLLIFAPIAAALVAAMVETIPVRLDDNLSVALTAGAVLWVASMIDADAAAAAWPSIRERTAVAVILNAAVAAAGYRARTVSRAGAITGAVIGLAIYLTSGWQGWTLLLVTFIAASVTSHLGLERKTLLGIAEERGGRRGAGNALANTGVAAVASVLAAVSLDSSIALVAFAAALAAGGSDTVASEIGKAWGRRTYAITTLQRVPPGTSGAMSLEGTGAGLAGALALGAVAAALHLVHWSALLPIAAAATMGSLIESWLGATLEGPGILNNDMLNFVNTAAAALLAVAIVGWLA